MICSEQYNKQMRTSGMTIIEIMIVVTIIGLFVGLAIPGLQGYLKRAKITKTKVRLVGLKSVVEQYKEEIGQYPTTLLDLVTRPSDPKAASRWRSSYIEDPEKDLQDAWGNEIMYRRNPGGSGAGKRPFELYSWGPEGEGSTQEEWIDAWTV